MQVPQMRRNVYFDLKLSVFHYLYQLSRLCAKFVDDAVIIKKYWNTMFTYFQLRLMNNL